MDKNIIKEMISRQLDLIIEQFNNLNKHKGKIPQIDLDIIKRNVSILYEQLFELEKENTSDLFDKHKEVKPEIKVIEELPIAKIIEEPKVEVEEEEEVTFPVDITPEPVVEEPVVKVKETPVVIKEEPVIVKETPVVAEEVKPIVKEEPTVTKETIEPKPPVVEKKEEKHVDLFGTAATTIADKFKKETKTVIDRLHIETANKTIGAKHQQHAVKDLKSAIGINEKFLFINELFKGNMKEFNDVVIKLNDFPSLVEAEAYLKLFKDKYNWADDLVSYLTLRDFVVRKYM